jgi:hypothetical protein
MTRVLTVFVVGALEALASAQPQAVPPSADPPIAAPGTSEPVVASGHDMAVRMTNAARNAAARGKCALIDRFDARVHELDAAYYEQAFATDPTIARCRLASAPPALSVAAPPGLAAAAPPPRKSVTIEAGIGASVLTSEGTPALRALGGPSLGVGSFVSPTLALSVRLSGSLVVVDGAFLYLGVLGPNAQHWQNEHVWLGGGLGLAILAGCGEDEGCDKEIGFGFDARVGFAFRPRGQGGANLSVEAMHDWFAGADGGVTTVSLMLGYQSF